jgi:hypothetical protein
MWFELRETKQDYHIFGLIFDQVSGKGFVGTEYIVKLWHGVQTSMTNRPDRWHVQEYNTWKFSQW